MPTNNHDIEVELRAPGDLEAYKFPIRELEFSESYNTGWGGTVTLFAPAASNPTPGAFMQGLVSKGFAPGRIAILDLYRRETLGRALVRRWPCRINSIKPFEIEGHVVCKIGLVDPISAFAHRPVWSAYRATSAADVVGGVLSAAAGGDGIPSSTPVLRTGPSVKILSGYRESLEQLPYVLAVGSPLGQWLVTFLGMLGLRAELLSTYDLAVPEDGDSTVGSGLEPPGTSFTDLFSSDPDGCLLILTDKPSTAPSLAMAVPDPISGVAAEAEGGTLTIVAESAWPEAVVRGGLVDDPVDGRARPIVASGGIGSVVSAPEVDADEAARRIQQGLHGAIAETLLIAGTSCQPLLGPGRVLEISPKLHGRESWQVASATHLVTTSTYSDPRSTYTNEVTLLRGDIGWFPPTPVREPPVFVSAIVSESSDVVTHEPVPRDRLGRIHVWFPFSPKLTGDEARLLTETDSNSDGRIRLADFSSTQIGEFEGVPDSTIFKNCNSWEQCELNFDQGLYDDPSPDKTDSQLTEVELATREELRSKRIKILQYRAYQEAKKLDADDRDRDGVVSTRDDLVSSVLEEALRDEDDREALRQAWDSAVAAGTVDDLDPNDPADALVLEYGSLFGDANDAGLDSGDSEDAEILEARADAVNQGIPRWPPKILLNVVEPMAGALHGFISGHRQGDTCRVAVHDPFYAEIIGFQYRNNRQISASLNDALTGLVVEHAGPAWSGLVFRRTADLEAKLSSDD